MVDRCADGLDFLRVDVGDRYSKPLLKRHDQFDDIQAVGSEILDKPRLRGHFSGFSTKLISHQLDNLFGHVTVLIGRHGGVNSKA